MKPLSYFILAVMIIPTGLALAQAIPPTLGEISRKNAYDYAVEQGLTTRRLTKSDIAKKAGGGESEYMLVGIMKGNDQAIALIWQDGDISQVTLGGSVAPHYRLARVSYNRILLSCAKPKKAGCKPMTLHVASPSPEPATLPWGIGDAIRIPAIR